jgi:hypothetical protein
MHLRLKAPKTLLFAALFALASPVAQSQAAGPETSQAASATLDQFFH